VSEETYELPDDIGETARSKVVQLRKLDTKLQKRKGEPAAEMFARHCREHRLPPYVREYEFAKRLHKGWRFDFMWVIRAKDGAEPYKLAVEIEGLVMRMTRSREWVMGGRHGTIGGFKEDCIKYATAAMLGWRLMRFEQSQVKNKFAVGMVMRALARNGWRANAP
jgi:hypothetical protein